jgi:hypothetical protein
MSMELRTEQEKSINTPTFNLITKGKQKIYQYSSQTLEETELSWASLGFGN